MVPRRQADDGSAEGGKQSAIQMLKTPLEQAPTQGAFLKLPKFVRLVGLAGNELPECTSEQQLRKVPGRSSGRQDATQKVEE